MKTFQEFILEAESTKPVGKLNQNQVFPIDKIFDNARPMGPGRGGAKVRPGVQPQGSTKPKLVPANIPMK
jgi:hypothetical protein